VCRSPCQFESAAEQEQNVTARMTGYYDTVANSVIPTWEEERDTYYLDLDMRPVPEELRQRTCYMQIRSFPEGLTVLLDGESVGNAAPLRSTIRVDATHRVEMVPPSPQEEYIPWARTFYPSPGNYYVTAIVRRIPHDPAQYSIVVDLPEGMYGTYIYIGNNQLGTDEVAAHELEEGDHHLILSYTPPWGRGNHRTDFDIALPAGMHVREHYAWTGLAFELVDREVGPLLSAEEAAELEADRVQRFERRDRLRQQQD
jgi:hypothetical protein